MIMPLVRPGWVVMVDTTHLTWKDHSFSGFASDVIGPMRVSMGQIPPIIRVRNVDTNGVVDFKFVLVERDGDGDHRAYHYRNSKHGIDMVIFND